MTEQEYLTLVETELKKEIRNGKDSRVSMEVHRSLWAD